MPRASGTLRDWEQHHAALKTFRGALSGDAEGRGLETGAAKNISP